MKKTSKAFALAVGCAALASCATSGTGVGTIGTLVKDDVTRDYGVQRTHDLQELIAGVWVDGNGCEHWIIDDGIEGYMSPRWGPDGKPYCPPGAAPFTTRGFNRTRFFESSMQANGLRNIPGEYTAINRTGFTNGGTPAHGGVTPYVAPKQNGDIQIQYVPQVDRR